jgi:hypothetical protein
MTTHPIGCTFEDEDGRERCEFCNFEVEFIEPRRASLLPYYRHRSASHLMRDELGTSTTSVAPTNNDFPETEWADESAETA